MLCIATLQLRAEEMVSKRVEHCSRGACSPAVTLLEFARRRVGPALGSTSCVDWFTGNLISARDESACAAMNGKVVVAH